MHVPRYEMPTGAEIFVRFLGELKKQNVLPKLTDLSYKRHICMVHVRNVTQP